MRQTLDIGPEVTRARTQTRWALCLPNLPPEAGFHVATQGGLTRVDTRVFLNWGDKVVHWGRPRQRGFPGGVLQRKLGHRGFWDLLRVPFRSSAEHSSACAYEDPSHRQGQSHQKEQAEQPLEFTQGQESFMFSLARGENPVVILSLGCCTHRGIASVVGKLALE